MSSEKQHFFSRNLGILTTEEQEILEESCVAVAGLGGVGGIQLAMLARTGIGHFRVADGDSFQISDRNRQYGSYESTRGQDKAEVMEAIVKDINPHCRVTVFPERISADNVAEFLAGADAVVDAIDSLKDKLVLYREARRQNRYVFTAPVIGFGSCLLAFDPQGLSLEKYLGSIDDSRSVVAKFCPIYPEYLDAGILEASLSDRRPAPSFAPSTALSAGLLASEVVFLLLGRRKPVAVPQVRLIDAFRGSLDTLSRSWKDFWTDFSREAYDFIGMAPENMRLLGRVAELAGAGKTVLDAGCGNGNLVMALYPANEVTAIDFSSGMLEAISNKTQGAVKTVEADVTSLPFDDETFDVVTSVNVLFNLDDPVRAIRETNRVLKRNGVFIVSSPCKQESISDELVKRVLDDYREGGVAEEDAKKVIAFNRILIEEGGMKFMPATSEMRELLARCGFDIQLEELAYYDANFLFMALKG